MENLGSKDLIAKLKRYSSDSTIQWYGGNLSRRELVQDYEAAKEAYELKRKEREEFNKTHKPGIFKRISKAVEALKG